MDTAAGIIVLVIIFITFLAGVGFREIVDGVTRRLKSKKSLAEMEEYWQVFDQKCRAMKELSDNTFEKWVQLEAELMMERRLNRERASLRSIR